MSSLDPAQVQEYLLTLQNNICQTLEQEDGLAKFAHDTWNNTNVINGNTRIISDGAYIEHGAVNFSHVKGNKLPGMATVRYPELAGASFEAMGISVIIHPKNPYVPTTHANIRFFVAQPKSKNFIWWFGGGYDLTPYYVFEEDCIHWHKNAHAACLPFGGDVYNKYKEWCDKYFYLPHRQETRGVGGLFFDDLNRWSFNKCFQFAQSIGDSFMTGYLPIMQKRKDTTFGERERDFQLYRRGRYVEFNLIHDRGTLFGLQSNGRTESILASLPPLAKWRYNWHPEPNTPEANLYTYLQPRIWLPRQVPTTEVVDL
ncbi:MAG TPA: oxygen-dependent coproporphyrinogen oxidase [Gammaproteobacteria bacterium]|nr:oxygen-dependent coproporphyrinogen oxidase [Gammaproteobacteria bacterium]